MTASVFISYSRSDSGYVQKLVAYLRENGVPAWADNAINHGEHWEDVKEWETFTNYLKSDREPVCVPFMAPDLPPEFVPRERELDDILQLLLASGLYSLNQ